MVRIVGGMVLVLGVLAGMGASVADEPVCTADAYVTRSLSGRSDVLPAEPIARFVNLSDTHIIDDEASPVYSGNWLDPLLEPTIDNGSAQRLQEEFTDEVLNAMITTINACHERDPLGLMIATGDLTDAMQLNEVRRYIDNLDGTSGAPTAYEHRCGYLTHDSNGAPKPAGSLCGGSIAGALQAATGRLVPDSQAPTPDPDDPTYQLSPTRTARQLAETQAASVAGLSHWIAPGLPPSLRCTDGEQGCANRALVIPHYAVLGNHDATVRGTVTFQQPFQAGWAATGRYFLESPREMINEFFFTRSTPGPVGHGFNHVPASRLTDPDDRNDGWYAFDAPGGVRMVVLQTIYDGVQGELHRDGATNADTRGLVTGNEATDPRGLAEGWMSDEQLAWLDAELAANAARPVLVFGHHPDRSFAASVAEASAAELNATLGRYGNVVAYIAGHTHQNVVRACAPGDCALGAGQTPVAHAFWRIETASIVDHPQEGRIVEVYALPAGGYALRMTMIAPDRSDPAVRASAALARAEAECRTNGILGGPLDEGPYDQGRLETIEANAQEAAVRGRYCQAEAKAAKAGGSPGDRDVILLP